MIAGIIRAGYSAFPISPRNSDAAVADLLRKSGAAFMLVSRDKPMQKLAQGASQLLLLEGDDRVMPFMDVPSFQEIYERAEPVEPPPALQIIKSDETVLILHSSGSPCSSDKIGA